MLRDIESVAIARVEGFGIGIPKPAQSIIFLKYPPFIKDNVSKVLGGGKQKQTSFEDPHRRG